jgi:hypothetical protein
MEEGRPEKRITPTSALQPVCRDCADALCGDIPSMPKFALANDMWIGRDLFSYLSMATQAVLAVARACVRQVIVTSAKLRPTAVAGTAIIYPLAKPAFMCGDAESAGGAGDPVALPPSKEQLRETLNIVLTDKTGDVEDLEQLRVPFAVYERERARLACENPGYVNVRVNESGHAEIRASAGAKNDIPEVVRACCVHHPLQRGIRIKTTGPADRVDTNEGEDEGASSGSEDEDGVPREAADESEDSGDEAIDEALGDDGLDEHGMVTCSALPDHCEGNYMLEKVRVAQLGLDRIEKRARQRSEEKAKNPDGEDDIGESDEEDARMAVDALHAAVGRKGAQSAESAVVQPLQWTGKERAEAVPGHATGCGEEGRKAADAGLEYARPPNGPLRIPLTGKPVSLWDTWFWTWWWPVGFPYGDGGWRLDERVAGMSFTEWVCCLLLREELEYGWDARPTPPAEGRMRDAGAEEPVSTPAEAERGRRFVAPAVSRWRKSRTFLNVATTMWRLLESVTAVKMFLTRPGVAGIIADLTKVNPKLLAEVLTHMESKYDIGTPEATTELPQVLKRLRELNTAFTTLKLYSCK